MDASAIRAPDAPDHTRSSLTLRLREGQLDGCDAGEDQVICGRIAISGSHTPWIQ